MGRVDFEQRQLEIVQQLPIERGKPVLKQLKTASGARIVTFGRAIAKVLLAHRTRQDEETEFAGPAWKDTGLVFTTALGGWVDPNNFGRLMDSLTEADLDELAGGLLRRFQVLTVITAGELRRSGIELRPTFRRPHYTVMLGTSGATMNGESTMTTGPRRCSHGRGHRYRRRLEHPGRHRHVLDVPR